MLKKPTGSYIVVLYYQGDDGRERSIQSRSMSHGRAMKLAEKYNRLSIRTRIIEDSS